MRLSLLLAALLLSACTDDKVPDTGDADTGSDLDTDTTSDLVDADADGYLDSVDCDDADPTIHPGADEACGGVDQDCDGEADDGLATAWYSDADADGFGDPATEVSACAQPANTVADATDCDDASAQFNPGAVEDDCADPADYNCDGSTGFDDVDGDGWAACQECDDGAALVNPSASETCNEVDDNCDGATDEGVQSSFYADADGDGFGDPGATALACEASAGWVADLTDCNDTTAAAYPGALEVCDGLDDDCDGEVDEEVLGTFYADTDGDGYGDPAAVSTACEAGSGWVADASDCDDTNAAYNPGAAETCSDPEDYNCDGSVGYADADGDGFAACDECDDGNAAIRPDATEVCDAADNDCDGSIDEADAADAPTWYFDADGDGYGTARYTEVSCDAPADYVAAATDCDDLDARTSPSASETCDGEDNDCDGATDEADATDPATWYADADGDTYGDAGATTAACDMPSGYVADATDCDDTASGTSPGADETCDERDNDCDGTTDESSAVDALIWYVDADGDGFGGATYSVLSCEQPSGYVQFAYDCDDVDADVNPTGTEVCNGDDDDCDGAIDEAPAADAVVYYTDADDDGYGDPATATSSCSVLPGLITDGRDCDDTNPGANPGATEVCDDLDVDEDCDTRADYNDSSVTGTITIFGDGDGDGYGVSTVYRGACEVLAGYASNSDDCDDDRSAVNPGADEVCDSADLDEDCNGAADDDDPGVTGTTTFYTDVDEDGYGGADAPVALCDEEPGYITDGADCDDDDDAAHPGATEVCDGVDNDCDGLFDEGLEADTTYYPDEDGDGFGDASGTPVLACLAPVGYRLDDTDCDDTSITVHPYAWEDMSNGIDDDCDGGTDGADTTTVTAGPTSDDSSTTVTLSGMTFPFCGTNRSTLYLQSNGRVTFGTSDTDYSETVAELASDAAIAPGWEDMYPPSGGTVKSIQYPDAVGLYWNAVPVIGYTTPNTFSAVLFSDGRVLLQYGALAMTGGIAGYSCAPGSITSGETDLGAAMDDLAAGRWGLGNGTERMLYESFDGADNDLDDRVVRLCPYVDGTTDLCAE
ncbi:MAG: putative metal-binding motif-containing protein [Pseudomonadota bacterium]|nr:putative metal-binding motif-containing protein [Pseudomonadota bacterium]